jgi:hypothetical protein
VVSEIYLFRFPNLLASWRLISRAGPEGLFPLKVYLALAKEELCHTLPVHSAQCRPLTAHSCWPLHTWLFLFHSSMFHLVLSGLLLINQKIVESNTSLHREDSVVVFLSNRNSEDAKPCRHDSEGIFNDPTTARESEVKYPLLGLEGLVWEGFHHGLPESKGVVPKKVVRNLERVVPGNFRKVQTSRIEGRLQRRAVVDPGVIRAALGANVDIHKPVLGVGRTQEDEGEGVLVVPKGGPRVVERL